MGKIIVLIMERFVLLILVLVSSLFCRGQEGDRINGKIDGISGDVLYLVSDESGKPDTLGTAYGQVKRWILDLGLNEGGMYDSVFRFIECYAEGDLDAYLTLCEKEYKSLEPSFQTDLLVRIPSLIDMNDQSLLKRTSKFIRSHLAELEPSKLYTVVMVLSQVERNMNSVNG